MIFYCLQHLEKTPNEYIRWRYAIGEDRENLTKVTRQISAEEAEKMAAQHKMEDGTKRVLDKLVSRRKMKKSYEYEVQWKNCTPDQNTYIVRDKCAPACLPTSLLSSKFLCILTCYAC